MFVVEEAVQSPAVKSTFDHTLPRGARVLIVADSATTHTHRWAQWAAAAGAEVTVLSPFADPIAGVRVIKFPPEGIIHRIPKLKTILGYRAFRRLIRQIDPQLIHFHFVCESGRAWYWDKIDVPMIGSAWGQDVIFDGPPHPKIVAGLYRTMKQVKYVTATTHMLARETAKFVPKGIQIHVIPFGVDLERFPARADGLSRDSGLSTQDSPITLGFVKWLKPKYGPDVMLEAFAKIHAARSNTRLVLAGKGEMQAQLEARARELKLEHAVEILGRVDHEKVPALIRSFDIMVMPSVYESETFGVAAIEASASGVPVVASRVGGVPEAVLDGVTGLLVPPRDVEQLAAACIELIDSPERRREMGVAGRRFVEKYYVWQDNTALMGEVYRAALEGREVREVPVWREGVEPPLGI